MSKVLRIVHTESSAGWGGQEIRILNETDGMIKRGHQVSVLAPRETKIFAEACQRNIPAVALPISSKGIRGVASLREWIKSNAVDVINTHSSTDSWLTALACATLQKSPPIVRTRHISAAVPSNWSTRWLYQTATRHIVTTGEALRQQLWRQNGFDQQRMTSIPTGIDTSYFIPGDKAAARAILGLPPDKTLIGSIATLRSWKGHRFLVEAFAALADDSMRLVIVGDGPQRENIIRQAEELGLSGKVVMPGNQSDVVPWLQALDVFVLASYANEGVPQALMQAMACGLPVVTTPVGSIPEIVVENQNAVFVPPQDHRAITTALEALLDDRALRDHLGTEARLKAISDFGLEEMLTRMETVFQNLVNENIH